MKRLRTIGLVIGFALVYSSSLQAQQPVPPKMASAIPPEITTPDTVDTRLGTLEFFDSAPSAATVQTIYDHLDFIRGVEVFLNTMRGASVVAFRQGAREAGFADGTLGIFETLMDSKSLFLTPNTETVYAMTWLNLKGGPLEPWFDKTWRPGEIEAVQ